METVLSSVKILTQSFALLSVSKPQNNNKNPEQPDTQPELWLFILSAVKELEGASCKIPNHKKKKKKKREREKK